MNDELDRVLRESGLPVGEYVGVRASLEQLRREPLPDPTPSAELAAMLTGGIPGPGAPARDRLRRRARLGLVAAVLAAVVGATGAAAAGGVLPRPIQAFLADVSERYLPFEVPSPAPEQVPRTPEPATPSPTAVPTTPGEPRQPASSAVPSDDGDGGGRPGRHAPSPGQSGPGKLPSDGPDLPLPSVPPVPPPSLPTLPSIPSLDIDPIGESVPESVIPGTGPIRSPASALGGDQR